MRPACACVCCDCGDSGICGSSRLHKSKCSRTSRAVEQRSRQPTNLCCISRVQRVGHTRQSSIRPAARAWQRTSGKLTNLGSRSRSSLPGFERRGQANNKAGGNLPPAHDVNALRDPETKDRAPGRVTLKRGHTQPEWHETQGRRWTTRASARCTPKRRLGRRY